MITSPLVVLGLLAVLIIVLLLKTAVIVPQRQEFFVERLGKFRTVLGAGFHILIPFLDKVAYKFSMKEMVIDVPSQSCITRDNVTVEVDGVIYIQVVDSRMAAYGIDNYLVAASQLAQTSLRSAIGKIDLDKTFEERESINHTVVNAVDEAAQGWGGKILRYEIKDIQPPQTVMQAMEQQMKAERQKRAEIAKSEGEKQSMINRAEGAKQEAIAVSEGEKQRRINEAQGRAQEIELVATATAEGLRQVALSLASGEGMNAANLRVAEKYLSEFGKLAQSGTSLIIPSNLSDIASVIASAMSVLKVEGKDPKKETSQTFEVS